MKNLNRIFEEIILETSLSRPGTPKMMALAKEAVNGKKIDPTSLYSWMDLYDKFFEINPDLDRCH